MFHKIDFLINNIKEIYLISHFKVYYKYYYLTYYYIMF